MGHLIRDGVIIGGTNVYVDNTLSTTSENPVQNKVITNELNNKVNTSDLSNVATTGDYNDLIDKPIIDNTLSNQSTNAVQNKVVTNSLNQKYSFNYDVCLSLDEWEALGNEKYTDHKNYYIYDVDMDPNKAIIYGFHIDPDESDPSACVTYLEDAVNMVPAHMDSSTFNYGSWQDAFFMPKPCMVKYDGTVDYYLNPDDYKQKKDIITITSTPKDELPLSFNSVDNSNINYHFYGNSNGAGVETENLFDITTQIVGEGLGYNGETPTSTTSNRSDYISVNSNTAYTLWHNTTDSIYRLIQFLDSSKTIIGNTNPALDTNPMTFTTFENCAYIRIAYPNTSTEVMLVEGSTVPTTYIPFGYKIPILMSNKPNLFDSSAVTVGKTIYADGQIADSTYSSVSDYTKISLNCNNLFLNWEYETLASSAVRNMVFYDSEKNRIGYYQYQSNVKTREIPLVTDTAYVRFSIDNNAFDIMLTTEAPSTSNYNLFIGNSKLSEEEYIDYQEQKIYKRTENLVEGIIEGANIDDTGIIINNTSFNMYIAKIVEGQEYTITTSSGSGFVYGLFRTFPVINSQSYDNSRVIGQSTFTAPIDGYIAFRAVLNDTLVMLTEGSTPPDHYIPHIQPIDPPVQLPTIQTYIGENILSSTETLNTFSIYAISDISNSSYEGNAMIEWPLIWWKYEQGTSEGEGYFYCSNKKVDSSYNCWCNINCDNQIVEHFYTAIYNGTGTEKLRSISGIALTSANGNGGTTYAQESTRALANNTTAKTEWFIDVWSDRMLINGLLILMGKSLNSQATFGRGLDTGGQTAKEAYVTGTLNDKGLFWGDTSAGTLGVKIFGMENWWGCTWHRTAGLIGLANGNTAYKMTYGTADGTTANGYNTTGEGYFVNTIARPASGYVESCKFGNFGYLPLATGGSSSTYYTDYWYTNNSILTFARIGGSSDSGVLGGVSYFYLNTGANNANSGIAAALTLKPLAKLT